MAITAHWYTLGVQSQWGSTPLNWVSDTIKVGLVTSAYTPSQNTDQYWSVPAASEISGSGYNAGGMTLIGKSVGNPVGNVVPLLGANISWTLATFTCRYAVIYKATGLDATSPLVGYVDFATDQSVTAGTFLIQWDPTNGVLAVRSN